MTHFITTGKQVLRNNGDLTLTHVADAASAQFAEIIAEALNLRTGVIEVSAGFCIEHGKCVCGGDTSPVRESCHNWRKRTRP